MGNSRIATISFLFFLTLLSGLLLSRSLRHIDPRLSSQPLAGLAFNVHKFVALATAILAGVTIRSLHRGALFSGIEWIGVILGGLFFLLTLASGGFLSVGKAANEGIRAAHKIAAVFTVVPTLGVIYLLIRSKR